MNLSNKIFQVFTISLLAVVFSNNGFSQNINTNANILNTNIKEDNVFDDIEIKDGKLFYKSYRFSEINTIDLSDLEIWDKTPSQNPIKYVTYRNPNEEFKKILLKEGLAKLKDGIEHQKTLLDAQEEAKQKGVGLWKDIATPQISPSINPNPKATPSSIDLSRLKSAIVSILWYILPLSGLIGLSTVLYKFFKRRKLYIVLLGSRATGKTTIFKRLFHPEDKPEECNSPKTTVTTIRKKANEQLNWGRYEVTPVYIDTGGGKFGEQASEMLQKDSFITKIFFKRSKYVWIIALAPTDNNKIPQNEDFEDKSNEFVAEQYGYLSLPVAFLTGKNISIFGKADSLAKPDLVILCITKSDLHLSSQNDNEGKEKLLKIFEKHKTLVEGVCKGIFKFDLKVVSACEGWDVHLMKRVIERELY